MQSTGFRALRFQKLWHTHGLNCSAACGVSQTRDQTRVPCTGRQILNHWTPREKKKVKVTQSCPTLCVPWTVLPARLLCPWNSPGQNTGVGSCSLLQGILPNQGSNPGLLHCRQILNHLSHQGSPDYQGSPLLIILTV